MEADYAVEIQPLFLWNVKTFFVKHVEFRQMLLTMQSDYVILLFRNLAT
jgi:hypothetical protein